jgi:hypothetical protein
MFIPSLCPEENMSEIEDVVSLSGKGHRKIQTWNPYDINP